MDISERIVRRLRPFIIGAALLSLPIFLISWANMMKMAFEAWPMWVFAVSAFSQSVVIVGLALFHDLQSERQTKP